MAQTVYPLANHDTLLIYNCFGESIAIRQTDSVDGPIDAAAVIDTYGAPFSISVQLAQDSPGDRATLELWDGDFGTGTLIASSAETFDQQCSIASGRLSARLAYSGNARLAPQLHLEWQGLADTSRCSGAATGIVVSDLTATSAQVRWDSTAAAYVVRLGDQSDTLVGHSIALSNLQPDHDYTLSIQPLALAAVTCCSRSITFRTNCTPHIGCIDLTDLGSGAVRGYYTHRDEPTQTGIVDHGSSSMLSHHTIHTDTNETDPRTGGLLRTVCPGTQASVRLGNWGVNAQSEALEYFLDIDTNHYALLLLHYAVVLQNPNHAVEEQPHFRMEVLDADGNIIDPLCGVADFSASNTLDWNSYQAGHNVWKDWTTVGFDMTPYQGQVVRVRFTTRDCTEGAHYGYAYFSAECSLNSATTTYCGDSDTNSITAPDGFDYLWYYDIDNPVSTDRTVYFSNNDALLHCRLVSRENPACFVTLNTYAGHRWPRAAIDTLRTEPPDCDGYRVYFVNRSRIINDDGDTVDWHCETAWWSFGDGDTSTHYSPHHAYHSAGDYTVTLVSGIAHDACRDTTHFSIHVPDYYAEAVKDTSACDTLWLDSIAFTHDTLGPQYRVHHPAACDTLYTLNLTILHSPSVVLPADTFCYSDTYSWRGTTVGDPDITDTTRRRLIDHLVAANGCDSSVILPLVQLPPDPLTVDYMADCNNKKYLVSVATHNPYLVWTSSPHDTCLDGHTGDDSILVFPLTTTTYTVTTDSRPTPYCPTSHSLRLAPVEFPYAMIEANPTILTYDHPEFQARDVSRNSYGRQWGLQTFPGNGDTIPLADTSDHIRYRVAPLDIDSVRIILAVHNDACHDTTHLTLPYVRPDIWAPTAFTPSEAGNNRFAPIGTGILEADLYIYDRAGRLVCHTPDLQAGWDGTRLGLPCPQGTYVWFLRYRTADYYDTWQTTSGSVTLIR